MPRTPPRSARAAQSTGMAVWAAKLALLLLLGLASAALFARFAVPVSCDLLLSTLPRLSAVARSYLVPPYIFLVVNFMIFVILKLPDAKNNNRRRATPPVAGASKPPPKALAPADPSPRVVFPNAWSDAAAPSVSSPDSSPKFGDSASGDWSTLTSPTDFDGPLPASSPPADPVVIPNSMEIGVALQSTQPSGELGAEEAEDDDGSLDATWRAITGGEAGRRKLKKNETWSAPPQVRIEPAARRGLRKSETFRAPSPPTHPRQTLVMERRVIGREVSAADDHDDDINRKFEAFIKRGRDQMRLQREESAAQRYVELVSSGGH